MSAILYPIAPHAEAALAKPAGRAARERDAERLAGEAVAFTAEPTGPAFATRDAALDAYAGRVEDDRPGRAASLAPEDRYCRLVETLAAPTARARAPLQPANRDGRRWPEPEAAPRTVWRLSISYWRIATAERPVEAPQARRARRRGGSSALDAAALRAMASQPLRPVEPQKSLDIGLFETRLPEAPHIIISDE